MSSSTAPIPRIAFGSAELLKRLDLVFGNSEHPHYPASVGWRVVGPYANGAELAEAGFHIVSAATTTASMATCKRLWLPPQAKN